MNRSKRLTLAMIVIAIILTAIGIFAIAANEPTVEIKLNNLSYMENVVIKYAVKADNLPDGATVGVKLLRNGITSEAVFDEMAEIYGDEYYVFDTADLSADEMAVDVYATPYIKKADGSYIYGTEKKSSVLEYAYKMLGKIEGGKETTEAVKDLLSSMLIYGACVQDYCGKNLDRLADADYYQVRVADGTLADGHTKGLYQIGDSITLKAKSGALFDCWKNSAGEIVSRESSATVTVSGTETYTAYYIVNNNTIAYQLDGGTLPAGEWSTYNAGTEFLLPIPAKEGYVFTGWYTSADFNSDNIISKLPASASGAQTVYAKWSRVISSLDGAMLGAGNDNASNTYKIIRQTNGSTETTDIKNTFSVDNGVLVWKQGNSKASQITFSGNLKADLNGARQFTFEVTLARPDGSSAISTNFRIRRAADNVCIILFKTDANGQVTLGTDGACIITTLENTEKTFRVTVDFDEQTISGYNERGAFVGSVPLELPSSETKYSTLDEYYNVMTAYRWQWYGDPATGSDTHYQLRVHNVSIHEGNSGYRVAGDGYTDEEREQMKNEIIADIADLRAEMETIYGAWTVSSSAAKKYLFKDYTADISTLSSSNAKKWGTAPTTPLDEHPRVLFTKEDIPAIREALEENSKSNKLFESYLKADVNGILPAVGTYVSGQNCSNYNNAVVEQILVKALAYQIYGNEYYGYQAIYAMKNYLKTLDIVYLAGDQYRQYGHVMFAAACVYDWCYDLLNDVDKRQFIAGVENCICRGSNEKGVKMEQGFPPYSQGSMTGHGSEYQVLRDYLSFAIAIYDENASWWNCIGARFYNDFVVSRNTYYVTGIASQGTSYVGARHTADLFSAWLAEVGTKAGTNPYTNLEKTVRSFLAYEFAPGYIFSDGDSSVNAKTSVLRDQTFISAMLFDDATLLAQGEYLLADGRYAGATQGLTLVPYVILRGRLDVEAAEDRYEGLDLISYNGSPLGQYVIRERYGDPDSAAVFMKLKEKTTSNHEHADAGTFQIYYKGLLTGDSGVYDNYNHDHSKYFNKGTIAHNGILIYDSSQQSTQNGWYSGGQRMGIAEPKTAELWKDSKYTTGTITGRQHGYSDAAETQPLYAYIAGDITKAYDDTYNVLSDRVKQANYVGRRMLTVYTGNEDFPMVFFVYDDVESYQASYVKKFLLQINSPDEPTVSGNTVITEKDDGRLVLTCLSNNIRIDKQGGRAYTADGKYDPDNSKNFLVGGKQCVTLNKKDDGHWGRVEIVYIPEAKNATFMNVLYVTDKGQTKTAPTITKVTGTGVEGAVFGDVAAVFMTSRSSVSSSISFTASGSGNISYYVSGVSAGSWEIKVGGVSYGTATATAEGGLLTFSAPAGTVTLTKK